jgi:hypothetical protein
MISFIQTRAASQTDKSAHGSMSTKNTFCLSMLILVTLFTARSQQHTVCRDSDFFPLSNAKDPTDAGFQKPKWLCKKYEMLSRYL